MKQAIRILKYLIIAAGLFGAQAAMGYANTPIVDPAYNSRIIDDFVFANTATMSVADIQNFLNGKVPTCDSYHGGATVPYVCLKDYIDPTTSKSAARLIYDEAMAAGLNPQVILVTLQKEQSLVTDTWPYPSQYKSAMGYGCPETQSVCDAQYYGFYNQVHLGATLLKVGQDRDCGNTTSFPSWSVNSKWARGNTTPVDGRDTFLQTCATGSLYNYTPHRPDSAYTLVSGTYYYGNYNFISFFNSWFGTTWAGNYLSAYKGQSSYPTLTAGGTTTVYLTYQNAGNQPWYDDVSAAGVSALPVHLSTGQPINRTSRLGTGWNRDQNRPAMVFATVYKSDGSAYSVNPHAVQPAESVKFSFTLTAPISLVPGTYREYFQPILEGGSTMNDPGTFLDVSVTPTYNSTYVSQSSYPSLLPGASAPAYFTFKNTGNLNWYDNTISGQTHVYLGTSRAKDRSSQFGVNWGTGRNIPATGFTAVYEADGTTLAASQHQAVPGQIVKLGFNFDAPGNISAGNYREWFQLYPDNGSSINDSGTFLDVSVGAPTWMSAYHGQSGYPSVLSGNEVATGYIEYTNTGNMPWYDDLGLSSAAAGSRPVHLATANPINRRSAVGMRWGGDQNRAAYNFNTVFDSHGNPYGANPHVVLPGESARFSFSIASDPVPITTVSREWFRPIVEGGSLMNDPGTFLDVTLIAGYYSSQYVTQSNYPVLGTAGSTAIGFITYKNNGNIPWYDDISAPGAGKRPVHLATSRPINRRDNLGSTWNPDQNRPTGQFASVYKADGSAYSINPHIVAPGESAQFSFLYTRSPGLPNGTYIEYYQPIVEGGSTMNDPGTFLQVILR